MEVEKIDHMVLTVKSIESTCGFFEKVLGFKRKAFGNNRVALHFGNQKINLHEFNTVVDKNVKHATPGSADFCFTTNDTPDQIQKHLSEFFVNVIEGNKVRNGALGPIVSFYFYDPDENLIELATYSQMRTLTEDYTLCYPDPLNLKPGDTITMHDKPGPDKWKGWHWCQDSSGKKGWISESHFETRDGRTRIIKAYNAQELTEKAGSHVTLLQEDCGWAWCESVPGNQGWLPTEILKPLFVN